MSYFLPPKVADPPPEPLLEQQAGRRPQTSASLHSVTKGRDTSSKINRSSSLGDWWRNMMPSQRPERGGTVRGGPFPSGSVKGIMGGQRTKPYDRVTDVRQSRRSEMAGSDKYTGWNLPRDVSESNADDVPAASRQRVPFQPTGANLTLHQQQPTIYGDRKWSWLPQMQLPEHLSVKSQEPRDRKVSWQDTALEDEPQVSASSLANRRLSTARRVIEAKKEARRQRRSLKESGDYLGVQGINPETGRLDVITPSNSDNSTESSDNKHKIDQVKQVLRNSRDRHKNALLPGHNERDVKRLSLKREKEKQLRDEKRKRELAARQNQGLQWKRHSKQWSSAQEPALSPIAQSLRSGTPVSRHPSKPFERMSQEGLLIDVVSSDHPVHIGKGVSALLNQETSGATSKSGTVIHTQKGDASGSETSSALELFENGIQFNQNAQSSKVNKEDQGSPPYIELHATGTSRRANRESKLATEHPAMPQNTSTPKLAQESGLITDNSFLGVKALGVHTQGPESSSMPRPLSATNLFTADKVPAPRQSISLFPKKHSSMHWLIRPSPANDNPELNFIPRSKTLDTLGTPTRTSGLGFGGHPSLEGSPLHRLSPTYLLQRVRKKRVQRDATFQTRSEVEVPSTALESLAKQSQVQPAQDLWEADRSPVRGGKAMNLSTKLSKEARITPAIIQEEIDCLRKEVSKVDELNWMKNRKVTDPPKIDNIWIEDTIKDITNEGHKIVVNPVSTLTITTTGSAQSGSGSSQSREKPDKQVNPDTFTTQERVSRRLNQAERNTVDKTSPPSRRRSSLLKLTPEGQIVPTDITSTDRNGLHNNHSRRVRLPSPSTSISVPAVEKENDAVTLTGRWVSPETHSGLNRDVDFARHQAPPVSTLPIGTHAPVWYQKHLTYNEPQKQILQRPRLSGEQLLQDLILVMPGAYPFLPGGDDDTDALFKKTKVPGTRKARELVQADANLWNAICEFFVVARCHVEVILRLYWSIAGPVFDSKSSYWARNKSGNATVMDCVAFLLAVPGAISSLLVFV